MNEHSIMMANRKSVELSGITNVINFDEEEIILETVMGYLEIGGEELHITMLNLDKGQVAVVGSINQLAYKPQGTNLKNKGKTILNRLLK
ncbi:MAG TPA: sporulation protein YabP [Syntrophomonas sp.]|jgi:sporulation protein YabP|nr:sporulation protein YabP [Syntrophomonas sp.]HRW13363.1 sporulation protein YabP [Syntrophomonas sp.]